MIFRLVWLFVALSVLTLGNAGAQTPAGAPRGITRLMMGVDVANGFKGPADPGCRVRVPPFERVTMAMPADWPHPIQWLKDNVLISGATGFSLTIELTTSKDSGRYSVSGAPFPYVTTGIDLEVVESGHTSNFSTLVDVVAGHAAPVVGFFVNGRVAKGLLIRAVGPSLSRFGINNGLATPRLRFFDGAGRELFWGHVGATPDMDALYRAVGAFPLQSGDFVDYNTLPPGAYTIQVSGASGQEGRVLLEVYELPSSSPGNALPVVPVTPIDPAVIVVPSGG